MHNQTSIFEWRILQKSTMRALEFQTSTES